MQFLTFDGKGSVCVWRGESSGGKSDRASTVIIVIYFIKKTDIPLANPGKMSWFDNKLKAQI